MSLDRSLEALLYTQTWALDPQFLPLMKDVFERRVIRGERLSKKELRALGYDVVGLQFFEVDSLSETEIAALNPEFVAAGNAPPPPPGGQKIAVLNVQGVIQQKSDLSMSGPGAASTEQIGKNFDNALADPAVTAIVLNIDSPGGSVYGVQELADKITAGAATGGKPVVAQVNSLAASAAYWIAAACPEIVITPSGQAGSIGVYTLHNDVSGQTAAQGVKPTFVSAGKYKVEGHQFAPLDDEAAGAMQGVVNNYYDQFTGAVAKGRGATQAEVKNGFGEGRTLTAKAAVAAKLADRVGTMAQTLKRLGATRGAAVTQAAAISDGPDAFDTGALMFLPEATPDQLADCRSIVFTKHRDDSGTITVTTDETPKAILISAGVLIQTAEDGQFIKAGAGKVFIKVQNGEAVYSMVAVSNQRKELLCVLQSSSISLQKSEDTRDQNAADDGSEYRRRRHRARMRGAM